MQIVRPTSDITVAGWKQNGSVSGTLWTQVDEAAANDGDYATSNVGLTQCEMRLGSAGDPDIDTDHSLLVRARKSDSATNSLVVRLMQGATQIATWTVVPDTTFNEYTLNLTQPEAAAIEDYTNLRVRLASGESSVANSIHVSQLYAALPDTGVPKREVVLAYEVAPVAVGQTRFGVQRKPSLERYGTTNDWYRLLANLGDERYMAWELQTIAGLPGPAGTPVNQISRTLLMTPALAVDSEGQATLLGAGWTVAQGDAAALGGSYRYTNTAGDSVSWTTPPETIRVGLRAFVAGNGGMARVLIDGDPTLANLLPTAQELVDWGRLAALGPFAATDRVLDQYPAATNPPSSSTDHDRSIGLAEGLAPGVHTIKLECTAAQSVSASGHRLYVSGFWYARDQTTPSTPGAGMEVLTYLMETDRSAWEYAIQVTSGGQTAFVGNIHGYEDQLSIAVYEDGALYALASGDSVWGDDLEVRRTTQLDHPSAAIAKLADVTTRYRLGVAAPAPGVGLLRIENTIAWWAQGVAVTASPGYPCMLAADGTKFREGRMLNPNAGPFDLTLADTDALHVDYNYGSAIAASLQLRWDNAIRGGLRDSDVILRLTPRDIPNTVANWAKSAPNYAFVQDRDPEGTPYGASLSKLYVTRVAGANSENLALGPTWLTSADYTTEVAIPLTIAPAGMASSAAVGTPQVIQRVEAAVVALTAESDVPGAGGALLTAGGAALTAESEVTAAGSLIIGAPSILSTGDGALSGAGSLALEAPMSLLDSDGALSGAGALLFFGTGALTAESEHAGAGWVRISAGTAMTAESEVVVVSGLFVPGGGSLTAESDATGAGTNLVSAGPVLLSGDADLSGAGSLAIDGTPADLSAESAADGAGALLFRLADALSGESEAGGTGTLLFWLPGDLSGESDLAVMGDIRLPAADVVMTADGETAGAGAVILPIAAALASESDLAGVGAVILDAGPLLLSGDGHVMIMPGGVGPTIVYRGGQEGELERGGGGRIEHHVVGSV